MVITGVEATITLPTLPSSELESLQRPKKAPAVVYQLDLSGRPIPVATKGGRGTIPLEALYPITDKTEPDHNLIGRLSKKQPRGDGHMVSPSQIASFYRNQLRIDPTGKRELRVFQPDSYHFEQMTIQNELQSWEVKQQHRALSILLSRYLLYTLDDGFDRATAMRMANPMLSVKEAQGMVTWYDQQAYLRRSFKQPKRGFPQLPEKLMTDQPQLTDGIWAAAADWLTKNKPDQPIAAAMLDTLFVLSSSLQTFDNGIFKAPDAQLLYNYFWEWGYQTVGQLHGFLQFLQTTKLVENAARTETIDGVLPLVFFDFPMSVAWRHVWQDEQIKFEYLKPLVEPVIGKNGQTQRETLLPETRLHISTRVGLLAIQPDDSVDVYKLRAQQPADSTRESAEQLWWWTQLLNVSEFARLGYITPSWHQESHAKSRDYRRTKVDAKLDSRTTLDPKVHAHHLIVGSNAYESTPISVQQKHQELFTEFLWYAQLRTLLQEKINR